MGKSTSNTRRQAALEREARKRAAAAASIKVTVRWVRDEELTEAERQRMDAAFTQLCLRALERVRGGHHGA